MPFCKLRGDGQKPARTSHFRGEDRPASPADRRVQEAVGAEKGVGGLPAGVGQLPEEQRMYREDGPK